jgi:hypothetical protein
VVERGDDRIPAEPSDDALPGLRGDVALVEGDRAGAHADGLERGGEGVRRRGRACLREGTDALRGGVGRLRVARDEAAEGDDVVHGDRVQDDGRQIDRRHAERGAAAGEDGERRRAVDLLGEAREARDVRDVCGRRGDQRLEPVALQRLREPLGLVGVHVTPSGACR